MGALLHLANKGACRMVALLRLVYEGTRQMGALLGLAFEGALGVSMHLSRCASRPSLVCVGSLSGK